MEKFYFTFGQGHAHSVNGKTFDKDTVAVIRAESFNKARDIMFDHFGPKWHNQYSEHEWTEAKAEFFPKGTINVNFKE